MARERWKDYFETQELENLTEELVFEELYTYTKLHQEEFCTCAKCLMDIAALVLNTVPPLYSASIAERMDPSPGFQKKYENLRGDIQRAIPRAVSQVKDMAHH